MRFNQAYVKPNCLVLLKAEFLRVLPNTSYEAGDAGDSLWEPPNPCGSPSRNMLCISCVIIGLSCHTAGYRYQGLTKSPLYICGDISREVWHMGQWLGKKDYPVGGTFQNRKSTGQGISAYWLSFLSELLCQLLLLLSSMVIRLQPLQPFNVDSTPVTLEASSRPSGLKWGCWEAQLLGLKATGFCLSKVQTTMAGLSVLTCKST